MSTQVVHVPSNIADDILLERIRILSERHRGATALLVAHLVEVERRRLFLKAGSPSLFGWCTRVLRLSEQEAYLRIAAARAARRFPIVLERLADGTLNLTSLSLISPHLKDDNVERLLDSVQFRTRRQIEEMVVRMKPLPPVESTIRRIPEPTAAPGSAERIRQLAASPPHEFPPLVPIAAAAPDDTGLSAPPNPAASPHPAAPESSAALSPPHPRPSITPLSPGLYRVQFTATPEVHLRLREAQELLRHRIPDGDPAKVIGLALRVLVESLKRRKFAATMRPGRSQLSRDIQEMRHTPKLTRHIPAAVRREVWFRDGGRCAFRTPEGVRCPARGALEFHHLKPWAIGGESTVENIELRCRSHHMDESERVFGAWPRNDELHN